MKRKLSSERKGEAGTKKWGSEETSVALDRVCETLVSSLGEHSHLSC